MEMGTWPVCYKDELIIGNAKSNTAICTLWTKRELLDGIPKGKFVVIGNLYSTYGINPMLRNMLANPRIRHILLCGADLTKTGTILLNFINYGIGPDYKVSGVDAYIDQGIPRAAIDELRRNVKVVDMRQQKSIGKLSTEIMQKLDEVSKEEGEYMEPILVNEAGAKAEDMYASDAGFRIDGNSITGTWLKALDLILKFGEDKATEYGIGQKELLDLVAVVNGDEAVLPEWSPVKEEDLHRYYLNFFGRRKPEGVEYTYGERLFSMSYRPLGGQASNAPERLQDVVEEDQINDAIEHLKKNPFTRRAIAVTWRHESDAKSQSPPCLVEIAWNIKAGALHQTSTFRSHDVFGGWLLNAFALRKLQKDIAAQLNVAVGSMIIMSISAHIYCTNIAKAEGLVEKHYRHGEAKFETDPRGFFIISIENGEIVAQHRVNDGRKSRFVFRGTKAQRIYRQILNENLISKFDHAAYIGRELTRAEHCIASGTKYVQDEA